MAAFNPGPLDSLCQILQSKIDFLAQSASSVNAPEYFLSTSEGLMRFILNAPNRVKKLVTSNFSAINYDIARARSVTRTHPTLEALRGCFETIIQQLRALNHEAPQPTAAELGNIGLAAARLWDLDVNRLVPTENFVLDLQKEKSPSDRRDYADRPLFSWVDPAYLERPTFKAFMALLDNFVAEEGAAEQVTAGERSENALFLELIMDTAVMTYCHRWLAANHKAPADRDEFIGALNRAWFGLYRRKVANDSSGFEHVFLGEREGEKVVGLHNWIQLRSEETSGRLNYKGKIRPKRRVPAGYPVEQLITIQFEWCGVEKFVSSSIIGTSPEFEIALYSLCFFNGQEDTLVTLGPHRVNVKAFKMAGNHIGSAFPEEAESDDVDKNRAASVIQKRVLSRKAGR